MASSLQRIFARLPIYLSDLLNNPRWIVMFVFGRILAVRSTLHALRKLSKPTGGNATGSIFGSASIPNAVVALESDGLFTGLQLPPIVADDIYAFAEKTPCYGNTSRKVSFLPNEHREAEHKLGAPILVGHYLEKINDCPRIHEIQHDPLLIEIAKRYIWKKPRILSSRMWWSFPTEGYDERLLRIAAQDLLHFDMNDWRSVKFFFYLTDVDKDSGAHVYVRKSHQRRRLRDQFTILVGKPMSKIENFYGADNFVTICGPAGFGFAEDPFGFHMGTVAKKGPRLVLEIEYGLSQTTRRQYFGNLVEADAVYSARGSIQKDAGA